MEWFQIIISPRRIFLCCPHFPAYKLVFLFGRMMMEKDYLFFKFFLTLRNLNSGVSRWLYLKTKLLSIKNIMPKKLYYKGPNINCHVFHSNISIVNCIRLLIQRLYHKFIITTTKNYGDLYLKKSDENILSSFMYII